jgi:hypothetical protein
MMLHLALEKMTWMIVLLSFARFVRSSLGLVVSWKVSQLSFGWDIELFPWLFGLLLGWINLIYLRLVEFESCVANANLS